MAASNNTPNPITLPPPNTQISKGSDNPIPLSPQWLLPKPGDNKTGMSQGENHPIPFIGYGDRSDIPKSPGNGEEMNESQRKKDVFRPTFLDADSGRRNRWRDEEREINPSIRKDRRREGEKEISDGRKTDRWADNSSTRHFGESRRPSSDRWADQSRENNNYNDQRRENKWNTRWGPDDKEVDKWSDVGKHVDTPHVVSHGKVDKEGGDHYRPWRPSSLQGRAKVDPPHQQTQTTSKEGPTFGHGRGRSENAPVFSVGRGRVNNYSVNSHSSGLNSERGDNGHGELSPFRYSRTKLLDIYRHTDVRSSNKILDGLMQVSSLIQEESLEPLALSPPTPEESAILKGIDKGEIVSSGAPPISKDGSTGRSSNDFSHTRRIRHGSRDDVPLFPDDTNDEVDHGEGSYSKSQEGLSREKQIHGYSSDVIIDSNDTHQRYGENKIRVPVPRDDANSFNKGDEFEGHVYAQSPTPWRSPSVEHLANARSSDWLDTPNDIRSRNSDNRWSQDSSYGHNELKFQIGEDSSVIKHPPIIDHDRSPEDLVLYYKDPQGQIQGPFKGIDIIGWFEAGYFGIDLQVRLANAPNETPFSLLGDVMPHLRAKARPPPGFNTAKSSEVPDLSSRSILTSFGKVIPGPSGSILSGNEDRLTQGSSIEAENRFIESLMSGDVSSSLERFATQGGLQGFVPQPSSSRPPLGTESGEALNLLAQRINLERQKSLNNPYSYWPNRDAAPVIPSPDITRNPNIPQANLLSPSSDMSRQSLPQNVEMMSLLQGLSDRSLVGINNNLGNWPNLPMPGGVDPFKDNKFDLHHGQKLPPQVAFGLQQHTLQPQNSPPLPNLLAQQTLDNPNNLLSSGLIQDPQALNLLQQQILMQQLQSQQSGPGPQLSLLDKILLIKQQQQKQEEQQLLRQQQLLSQVLSEQQLTQRFGDLAFSSLVGNTPIDHSAPQPSPSMFQTSVSSLPDDRISNIGNLGPKVPQDLGHVGPTLPHQMLGLQQNFPNLSTHVDIPKNNNMSLSSEMMDNLVTSESFERPPNVPIVENSNFESDVAYSTGQELPPSVVDSGKSVLNVDSVPSDIHEQFVSPRENENSVFERTNDSNITQTGDIKETSVKECHEEVVVTKEASNVEVREVKKTSEKKSRKSKSSKAQSSPEQGKGVPKESTQKSKQSEVEGAHVGDKSEESLATESQRQNDLSNSVNLQSDVSTQQSVQMDSTHRAWKPPVSVKPKSLLEIQQEEQRKVQMEIPPSSISTSIDPLSSSTPWGGVNTHVDPKVSKEIHNDGPISEHKTEFLKGKRSGLHDLLAAEVLAKSSERNIEVDNSSNVPPLPSVSNQRDVIDDDNFIEAKDTKKSRKKAAKAAKVAGSKSLTSISSTDMSVITSSPIEKGKSSKHVQIVKEVLPAPPSGPSLGDFVPWKGEPTSPSPGPAWSTDSGKFPKPASLRDILKEQEKKGTSSQQSSPIVTPQKSQTSQARSGSWSVSALSPSKGASPVQVNSKVLSQSKSKVEEDLFWGPLDQNKQESKQAVFPQLGNQGNWATKSSSSKATPSNRQKSSGSRGVDVKGKQDGSTKHLEAMDFRDWCENESVRLTGSKDTSFLEYCSKQSRSEAQTLLIENLGSFDPNHEFIEKFLNYMELLSADVLKLAFQSQTELRASFNNGAKDMNSESLGFGEIDKDGVGIGEGSNKGGKKKGKKGKKVSPSVLGFNVVSNRIMMGEIQTVED